MTLRPHISLPLSLYIYIYVCVCVRVCIYAWRVYDYIIFSMSEKKTCAHSEE
jgi:hypothetical protein